MADLLQTDKLNITPQSVDIKVNKTINPDRAKERLGLDKNKYFCGKSNPKMEMH